MALRAGEEAGAMAGRWTRVVTAVFGGLYRTWLSVARIVRRKR